MRRLTHHHGALLIYDEVMTGFRLALGGAQELFSQQPDLTVLGKIVGGGLPVGAYGGRADIMSQVMPAGPVFQAGTLSGNPLAMAAGLATLQATARRAAVRSLGGAWQTAGGWACGRGSHRRRARTRLRASAACGRCFSPPIRSSIMTSAKKSDTARFARFFWAMMERGIYLPCSQFEAAFISAVHTEEHIEETITAAHQALVEIAN